nr:hypothetical protein [Neisseria sp.]
LASNAVVMHNGLVFEVYGIFAHKKTAPSGLDGGVSNFWGAVQGSDGLLCVMCAHHAYDYALF